LFYGEGEKGSIYRAFFQWKEKRLRCHGRKKGGKRESKCLLICRMRYEKRGRTDDPSFAEDFSSKENQR